MTSFRPEGDKAWDYCRILPSCKDYVVMDEISPDTYECVVLDGLKSKTTSNSDNPPNSFRTRDLFIRHKTLDAWKHMGRLDDRVTLMNGEKVLPLPMEGRIKEEKSVLEAIIFGIGKFAPGLILIRSDLAKEWSDEYFLDQVWPAVDEANSRAESFSRIDRDMIVPLPAGTEYPRTDKGTFIRAQVYRTFAAQIEQVYSDRENGQEGSLDLDLPQLEEWLMRMFAEIVNIHLDTTESDFFSAGCDSLQAIKMWSLFKKELYLGDRGAEMTQNAVFEQQNVAQLSRYLLSLKTGTEVEAQDEISVMRSLIDRYSSFSPHQPGSVEPPSSEVLVGISQPPLCETSLTPVL